MLDIAWQGGQTSLWKHQCFPSSSPLISKPRGKAALGNRCSRAPFKGWRWGLKSRWLPGSRPPKKATAVSSRAAEMEARPPRLGWGRHNRPPFGGSHRSASEEPFHSFKTWKPILESPFPLKRFNAVAAVSPPVEKANSFPGFIISVASLCLA